MTTMLMLALSGVLALLGAGALAVIVVAAFRDSLGQGMLALLVPGYALYYGWRTMKKPMLPAGAMLAFLAAGAAGFFSTAFEPNLTTEDASAFEDGFEDLDPPPTP